MFDEAYRAFQDAFARPITVHPVVSQRNEPPFAARGIWRLQPADANLLDGGVLATDHLTVAVRGSEFAVPPVPGDRVTVDGVLYVIDDDGWDGQGGYTWVLKQVEPGEEED